MMKFNSHFCFSNYEEFKMLDVIHGEVKFSRSVSEGLETAGEHQISTCAVSLSSGRRQDVLIMHFRWN